MTNDKTELVLVAPQTIPQVFTKGGTDPLIEKIREQVSGIVGDITTASGRKDIASRAYRVARSKTYLDSLGKELVATIKTQAAAIDKERKHMRGSLDALRDEIRAPLTEWEDTEEKRQSNIQERIHYISNIGDPYSTIDDLKDIISDLESIDIFDGSFEEFEVHAAKVKEETLTNLQARLIVQQEEKRKTEEAQRIELARIEKERIERETRIAAQAAEKARKEAEDKARLERLRIEKKAEDERNKIQAEARAKILDAERAELEARRVAERAEQKRRDEERKRQADEEARRNAEENAARIESARPDIEKLRNWAQEIAMTPIPDVSDKTCARLLVAAVSDVRNIGSRLLQQLTDVESTQEIESERT